MIDRIDHIVLNCRDVEATGVVARARARLQARDLFGPRRTRSTLKFGKHKFNLCLTKDAVWWTCKVGAPGSLDLCFVTKEASSPSSPGSRPPAFQSSLAQRRGRVRSVP